MPRPTRTAAVPIVSAALLLLVAPEPSAVAVWPAAGAGVAERYARPVVLADSLNRAGRRDSAHALVGRLIQDATARRDERSLAFLLRLDGTMWAVYGGARQAEPLLRRAVGLARRTGDSATLASATRWLAVALEDMGRHAEAAPRWHELLALARARRDANGEGAARMGLAYQALVAGDYAAARAGYARAAALLRSTDDVGGELNARTGLGRALTRLGDFDGARDCFLGVADEAASRQLAWHEAKARNNLGTLEFGLGDPGRAVTDFERALALERGEGVRGWIVPATNLAVAQRHLGRLTDAAATLEDVLAACRAGAFADLEARTLLRLAGVRETQGRTAEAARLYRGALSLGPAEEIQVRVDAALGLAGLVERSEGPAAALRALEREALRPGRTLPPDRAPLVEARLGRLLLAMDRPREALARLRRADRALLRLGMNGERIAPLTTAARCWRSLGEPDSAVAALERAASAWEERRDVPVDPEWREALGAQARDLCVEQVRLHLVHPAGSSDGERVRRAYDLVQRYKARTLRERMLGPGAAAGPAPAAVTLAEVQASVLAPDEVLLDVFCGADTTFVFVVTRDAAGVLGLPGERVLAPRLRLFRDLVASPLARRADEFGAAEAAGAEMGRVLSMEAASLPANRRVVVAPDGPFCLAPLAAWSLPGATPPRPLLHDHEVVMTPSATILADLRRPGRRAPHVGAVLAIAVLRTPAGEALPGAVREARGLARAYRGVDLRLLGGDPGGTVGRDLGGYGLLHLAAHVEVDDERPWRSGVFLGGPGDTSASAYLRAGDVAAMRLQARLAVLSGCQTAGERALSGEGLQGLAAGFLSAGVPAVVATLWPVDDRVTARLAQRFYAGLSRGESVGSALRAAQLDIRRDRATRHAYYWAGFTVIGDGSVTVPLERRDRRGLAAAGAALVLGGAVVAARRRRAHGR